MQHISIFAFSNNQEYYPAKISLILYIVDKVRASSSQFLHDCFEQPFALLLKF